MKDHWKKIKVGFREEFKSKMQDDLDLLLSNDLEFHLIQPLYYDLMRELDDQLNIFIAREIRIYSGIEL